MEPIVSTMQAYDNNQIPNPCIEGMVTPYQSVAPAGKKQCFPKSNLRYFYKLIADGPNTYIMPNSMWSQRGKPSNMCNVLEYKMYA